MSTRISAISSSDSTGNVEIHCGQCQEFVLTLAYLVSHQSTSIIRTIVPDRDEIITSGHEQKVHVLVAVGSKIRRKWPKLGQVSRYGCARLEEVDLKFRVIEFRVF